MKAALGKPPRSKFSPPPNDANSHTRACQDANLDAQMHGHVSSDHNGGEHEYCACNGAECRLYLSRKPVVTIDLL